MTGILLVNLGTPDSSQTSDVRKYLREFLMDGRVIDIPAWKRWLLVNLIIAPFRSPKSAKEYQKLWTSEGSPLRVHSQKLTDLVQQSLGENYVVRLGMRYQNPSISSALAELQKQQVDKIIILPLFPQYASATTGSIFEEVMRIVEKQQLIPQLTFIDTFATNPKMIQTFATLGKQHLDKQQYDHILFSYHGLPERQLKKADKNCLTANCCTTYHKGNRLCYKAQCFETSRLLVKELGLSVEQHSTAFQSRLGKAKWIAPYTTDAIANLAAQGVKKLLVFCPAFVADCLETTIEIGEQYKEEFIAAGGEKLTLVESLNSHPLWVETVCEMVAVK